MHAIDETLCFLRLFNSLPGKMHLDCQLDSKPFVKTLMYQDFSPYKAIPAGTHELCFFLSYTQTPLYTQTIRLNAQNSYTLILFSSSGTTENLEAYLLQEPYKKIPEAHFLVRTLNLCYAPHLIKLSFLDTSPTFKKLAFAHSTSYLAFNSDTYSAILTHPETKKILLTEAPKLYKPDRYYALYIVGGLPGYPLNIISAIEGNSLHN